METRVYAVPDKTPVQLGRWMYSLSLVLIIFSLVLSYAIICFGGGSIFYAIELCSFTCIVAVVFYFQIAYWDIMYQNTVFKINDSFIESNTSMSDNNLNWVQKYFWKKHLQAYPQPVIYKWEDVTELVKKATYLELRTKEYDNEEKTGIMVLPKEIQGIDELESFIRQKIELGN